VTDDELDEFLRVKASTYPALFAAFRRGGWSEAWRADPASLAKEPYWPRPFPMHGVARSLLGRFAGLHLNAIGSRSLDFGCARFNTSSSLKIVRPYEVEEFLLNERSEVRTRPPAFPIGSINDEMMFMREDWSTITVGHTWGWAILSEDPFEVINAEMQRDRSFFLDATRCWQITDPAQVPEHILDDLYV